MALRRIVIAGAGIGGLTAALALAARGFSILVLEKAEALQPMGAGVQLSPNASRVLIGLGLRDALGERATAPDAVILNSVRAGGEIARLPAPQSPQAPYWVVHRADLQAALLASAVENAQIELRLGADVTDVAASTGAAGVISGGETMIADALIAADGVHSVIRRALFPQSAPLPSGWTAWRGMAEGAGPAEVQVWMGHDAHLVTYPVAGGARTNLVLTLPDGTSAAHVTAGWPAAPCSLIESVGTLTPYPLATAPPLAAWSDGHIALLGDAAHAMLPFAAQGAAMAIEDAAVLAGCVTQDCDIPTALAHYAALRRPRVARVARAARQAARIYHLGGMMALARDCAIRALGGRLLMRRQNWIYSWRA